MHKVLRSEFRFHLRFALICLLFLVAPARLYADLRDGQSFKPIEWDADFSKSRTFEASWIRFPRGVQHAQPAEKELFDDVRSGVGLQLGQWLRDRWQGRMSLLLAQTDSKVGGYVWTFLGSDLKHPLIFGAAQEYWLFSHLKPYAFFGLGVSSRWENSQVRYNLIPTYRYEVSEPAIYFGTSLMIRLAGEFLLSLEFRHFESARSSKNSFPLWGASLVWGDLEKK